MAKPNNTPDPRKVYDLKDKARREANMGTTDSSATIEDTLYGPQTENNNAVGGGEFDN